MENKQNIFEYTYSAKEADEIRSIREKYMPKQQAPKDAQLEALRKLDKQVTNKATAIAVAVGVIGVLVLGFGMSLCLSWNNLTFGIPVGVVGAAVTALALPLYNRLLAQEQAKVAPQILKLSEALLGESTETQLKD